MHAPLGSKTLGAFCIGSQPSDRAACEAAEGHIVCQSVYKKSFTFTHFFLAFCCEWVTMYIVLLQLR